MASTEGDDAQREDGEKATKWEFFTRVALAGSQELRALLPMTETHYRKLAIEAHSDARSYFLYSVLDSVYQVGVAMMRWEDLVEDDDAEHAQSESVEERLVHAALDAEAAMWTRRLLEVLATLVCFSKTNEEPYYRHFLFLDQLEAFIFKRKDQLHYFDCEQKSILHWIESGATRIRALEARLDITRCWYLKEKRALPASPRKAILNSFAERLRFAVPNATLAERAQLGLSYQQFSSVSTSIHFSPGERWYDGDAGDLGSHFSRCWLLVQAVLMRVIELADLHPTGICAKMINTYGQNTTGDELTRTMTTGRGKVGDFVVVGRSLARIVRVKHSAYGYESYTVRFIADPPSPTVSEDDALPYQVQFLRDADALKQKALERLKAVGGDKATDLPAPELDSALEQSFRELWDLVLKDRIFKKSTS